MVRPSDAGRITETNVFELEADRIAAAVLSRDPQLGENHSVPRIQPLRSSPSQSGAPPVHVTNLVRSSGVALAPTLRRDMELRFGRDFSAVRIHLGAMAERSADALGARAYATGWHIVFGSGEYAPATDQGRHLIAHELAHVVQQCEAGVSAAVVVQCDPLDERESETDLYAGPSALSMLLGTTGPQVGSPAPDVTVAPAPMTDDAKESAAPDNAPAPTKSKDGRGDRGAAGAVPRANAVAPDSTSGEAGVLDAPAPQAETSSPAIPAKGRLPRLMDLLPEKPVRAGGASDAQISGNGSPAGIPEFEIVSAADRRVLLGALSDTAKDAKHSIGGQAGIAADVVEDHGKKASAQVDDEIGIADDAVKGTISKRRTELEGTIRASEQHIRWQKQQSRKAAQDLGEDTKRKLTASFQRRYDRLNEKTEFAVKRAQQIRDHYVKLLREGTAEHVADAQRYASNYYKRFIVPRNEGHPGREAVSRAASDAAAAELCKDFNKSADGVAEELGKATTQIETDIRYQGSQVLIKYLGVIGPLLDAVDNQVKAAVSDIDVRAMIALEKLRQPAQQMLIRLDTLRELAIGKNHAIAKEAKKQVTDAQEASKRAFMRGAFRFLAPITGTVEEGKAILARSPALHLDRSWQFVGEIIGFSRGATEDSVGSIRELRATIPGAFARPGRVTRKACGVVAKELGRMLHEEGIEVESRLTRYGLSVDDYVGGPVATLDKVLADGRKEAVQKLADVVNGYRSALNAALEESIKTFKKTKDEAYYGQKDALRKLPGVMDLAARTAAWEYEHEIMAAIASGVEYGLKFVGGILVAVAIIVTVVLALEALLAVFVAVLGEFIGTLVFAAILGFAAGYTGAAAYEARRNDDQGVVHAFFGAIGDVLGVTSVYKAFAADGLSAFERGKLFGEGLFSIFTLGKGALSIAEKFGARFPKRLTDPRLATGEAEGATSRIAGDVGASPHGDVFKRIPEELPPPPKVTGEGTPSPRVGELGREPPPPAAEIAAEVKPSPRVEGFGRGGQPARPAETPAPVAETTGGPPPSNTQIPPAREVPTSGAGAGEARGAQGAVDSGSIPPKASGSGAGEPIKGTVTPAKPVAESTEGGGLVPGEPAPATGAKGAIEAEISPAGPARPKSIAARAAEQRHGETQKSLGKAEKDLAKADEELAHAQKEFEDARDLRARRGDAEDKKLVEDLRKEKSESLRDAKAKQREAKGAVKDAAKEAKEVADARSHIERLEKRIEELDREMAEIARDPTIKQQYGTAKGATPPTSSKPWIEYSKKVAERAKALESLESRTKDLTKTLAEQTRRMTPGEGGQERALQNAEELGKEFDVLKPAEGRPIDVTTGKPIEGTWESDHIIPRVEIAGDARYGALDRAGRETMINGIPQNELPLETLVNRSKQDTPLPEWLMKRAKQGKPIDAKIAEALREAHKRARKAVDDMFDELLKKTP
jgi:hypothetical protein